MAETFPSLAAIKRVIPTHCFKPSIVWSFFYLLRTISISILLVFLFYKSRIWFGSSAAVHIFYSLIQGTVFWGLFVIGHDCGHGSFSSYDWLNWIVGNTVHSVILTPYEPWRLSHRSHHKNTCNLEKDEIFYPNPPIAHSLIAGSTLGGAWFLYILFKNVSGRKNYFALAKPWGSLCISFFSLGFVLFLLYMWSLSAGFYVVLLYYVCPLFVFASWLVVVTFLHHNDETVPWYTSESWTYVKGSLSSIDRDYGWLINTLSNNINLHQIHHLFPKIPHYHLAEATASFRDAFPHLVKQRGGFNMFAFYANLRNWATSSGFFNKERGTFHYMNKK